MIFLYSFALFLLGVTHFVIKRRVASLEKKYLRVALEADALARQSLLRQGNAKPYDACQVAKRQLLLGQLTEKRDRVESRYTAWQTRSDRLAKLIARVRGWKGRTLPYTFGALDVAGALALIDYLGVGQQVSARVLVQSLVALFQQSQ